MDADGAKQKIPTDHNGKPLHFTGEENFSEFRTNFFRYCVDNDLSDVGDTLFTETAPQKPLNVIAKLSSGEELTEAEERRISTWRTYNSKHNAIAGKTIGMLKRTLSPTILELLRTQHSIDESFPSIDELHRIFGLLKYYYGRYNYHRARLSLQDFEGLPQFTDSKSIKSNLFKITTLQKERTEWSDLQPAAGAAATDYRFTDVQLKENIMRMMAGHTVLTPMLITFRMQAKLTYEDMCKNLIDIATNFMQPDEEQVRYKHLSRSHSASKSDSTSSVIVDPIVSNLNAMVSDAQSSDWKRCHNCGSVDHFVKNCPMRLLCPKCNQLGHTAEYCHHYSVYSDSTKTSVLGKRNPAAQEPPVIWRRQVRPTATVQRSPAPIQSANDMYSPRQSYPTRSSFPTGMAYSQLSPPPRGNFSSSQSPRPSNPMRIQARNTNSARGFYSQQTSLPNPVRPISGDGARESSSCSHIR
jgi:hypothetical protein